MQDNPEIYTHSEKSENPSIKMGAATLASPKHPHNEDTAFMDSDSKSPLKVFGVLDGMGGHAGGAEASKLARDTILERINQGDVNPDLTLDQAQGLIKSVLVEAHENVKRNATGELTGMGTTASVGMLWEGKNGEKKLVVGNIGDSRIYIYRDGKLQQITVDDDLGSEGKGHILTQAIGLENIDPKMGIFDIHPGDQIITISDGISDAMGGYLDEEFHRALAQHKGNPTEAANALVKRAREYSNDGHKMDDQTAIVVEISDPAENNASILPTSTSIERKTDVKSRRFENGTMVNVKRSSGEIEDGWFVMGINEDGKIRLINSGGHTKTATQEQLNELNPPVESSRDWDELKSAINRLPDIINGSTSKFTKEQIIVLCDKIRSGETPLSELTRANGLRSQVEMLLQLDQARKDLKAVS